MAVRIEFTAPEELVEAMNKARGERSRASFIKWALGSALGGSEVASSQAQPGDGRRTSSSAPTRTSDRAGRQVDSGERFAAGFVPRAIPPCPDCGKANGVHKGDCPNHPGRKR